ncbi:hypothetical protein GCM10029963_37180 [Micromonospora andamanensis]
MGQGEEGDRETEPGGPAELIVRRQPDRQAQPHHRCDKRGAHEDGGEQMQPDRRATARGPVEQLTGPAGGHRPPPADPEQATRRADMTAVVISAPSRAA